MDEPEAETPEQALGEIAKAAEERAHGLVERARKANAEAEKALKELANSPLMTNGMGRASKEAHQAAAGQDERLLNLLQRIHEHFNPKTTPEEG